MRIENNDRRQNLLMFGTIAAAAILLLSLNSQIALAHQRALYTIDGKDYLFVIGSLNEPVSVDDKTGVEFRGIWPNATDPTNSQANGTQPITGLENSLKVEISAGDKNMTSDLEPAFGELGSYESKTFYPTIQTTYSYRIFGDINGTSFDQTFACNPAGGEAAEPDNSTVQISQDVVRKALIGGFGCPEPRLGFPESYLPNVDIQSSLGVSNASENSTLNQ
jgi:hypothetical protein